MNPKTKIKTFLFKTTDYAKWPYKDGDIDTTKIDKMVNEWMTDKSVLDIKVNTFWQGNNPPATFAQYTITYEYYD